MNKNSKFQIITDNKKYDYYIFASDPHGRGEPWINLVKQAINKYPTAKIVFGGDYIDGRKNSKDNLDFIIQQVKENNAIALLGNHEDLMIDYLLGNDFIDFSGESLWFENGGKSTVRSILLPIYHHVYGAKKSIELLKETPYYNFIKSLPILYDTPNIIFVHAGVKPDKQYKDVTHYDNQEDFYSYMLWERQGYWSDLKYFKHNTSGKTIVTGHTPTALISGQYDKTNHLIKLHSLPFTKCPVRIIQYPGEPARIFTDNGCHNKYSKHNGNVVVLDYQGNIKEIFN